MGGFGSGRHGGKGLTSDYRALDVRQLGRLGRLTPGQAFDWSWTRDGKTVGVIRVRTEADRVIAAAARNGRASNIPCVSCARAATLAARGQWFICPTASAATSYSLF